MNLISLVVWGGIISYGIQLSNTGIILVGLEGIMLQIVPPLLLLLPFAVFFLLPMARRYRNPAGRNVSRVPQVRAQASRGVDQ